MKVEVIGASGMAEWLTKENPQTDITGIVRRESKAKEILGNDANLIVDDVFAIHDSMINKFDVIIDAFGFLFGKQRRSIFYKFVFDSKLEILPF